MHQCTLNVSGNCWLMRYSSRPKVVVANGASLISFVWAICLKFCHVYVLHIEFVESPCYHIQPPFDYISHIFDILQVFEVHIHNSNPGLVTYPHVFVERVVGCDAGNSLRNLINVCHHGDSRLTLRIHSDLNTYESLFYA